jgi:hypothetical protein
MYAYGDLIWTGDELRIGRRIVAAIEPDREWPGLWRARVGQHLTDMTNRTRAKDAAICLVVADLNARQRRAEGAPTRYFAQPVSVGLST